MCKTKILICAFLILRSALLQASNIQQASTPTGPAGGALTGTYPNPTLTGVTSLGAIAVGSSTTGVLSQVALGSAGAMLYAGASGPVWSSTSALAWDAANGRLGIGTASPTQALQINGGILLSGRMNYEATGAVYQFYDGTNYVFRSGLGAYRIDTATISSPFTVLQNGSVGIGPGNTSPSGTLNCSNRTPTTGSTSCDFQAGPGQSGNVIRVLNNAGTEVFGVDSLGAVTVPNNVAYRGKLTSGVVVDLFRYNTANAAVIGANEEIRLNGSVLIQPPSTGTVTISGGDTDGPSAVGVRLTTTNLLSDPNAKLVSFRNQGTERAFINAAGDIRVRDLITTLATPASAGAACTAGTWEGDANFLYFCTATNTWKRVAISTW